jgi:hypothetical protein
MKRLLLLLVLGFAAWKGYEHFAGHNAPQAAEATMQVAAQTQQASGVPSGPTFQCDGRQHCSQMTSRAEAEFFIRDCPDTKMDGDRDGEPCENDSRF